MVVIIGCGVSGLTCGILLQEAGHEVQIFARELPPITTSNIAAAVWYPYKAYPIERVLQWSQVSFSRFCDLMNNPETGVSMMTLIEVYKHAAPDIWWKEAVLNFRHSTLDELPDGYLEGYTFDVPFIETPIYMRYLMNRFLVAGGHIQQRLVTQLDEIEAPLMINCAGLGARELVKDTSVYPIRGQIVRTSVPADSRGWLAEDNDEYPVYIFPRSQDCVIGGTAQENNWSLEANPQLAVQILENARSLLPSLDKIEVLEHLVGLRPGRPTVRLEREVLPDGKVVIHNYGHGGAGFTLSWGCAEEVVSMMNSPLKPG